MTTCNLDRFSGSSQIVDRLVDVDPAFYVVWSRFRMVRMFFAHCPEGKLGISRMTLSQKVLKVIVLSIFSLSLLPRLVLPMMDAS